MPRRGGGIWAAIALVGVATSVVAIAAGGAAGKTPSGARLSSATSQALFDGDFETGTYKPWSAAQASNYGNANTAQVHFGTFNVDTQILGQGHYSGKFALPAWSGGRTRSQVFVYRSVNVGSDDYYSLMFYVPQGWSPGTNTFWGVSIAELNFQNLGSGGPTIALQAHANHVTLAMQTGVTTTTFPTYQFRSNADSPGSPNLPPLYAIPPGMQQGVWHELVLHVRWATSMTGVVEVWHRLKGQSTWTKTASLSGYPTLQVNPNGSYPAGTLDVIQAYRANSTAPTTVWLDAFTRSTSFSTAAGQMP